MEAALVPSAPGTLQASASRRLVEAFLSGRNERTLQAYGQDLEDFRRFTGAASLDEAARVLLGRGHGEGNALALSYRADLMAREPKLAPATINRRLAALRSLVKLSRVLGLVPWSLEVSGLESAAYRDTRGPGRAGVRRLLEELEERVDVKAKRDRAALHLLYDLALRRAEVVGLDVADVDLEGDRLAVLGKKRTEKEWLTLPPGTKAALVDWLQARGTKPGAFFLNFDHAGKGGRLTGTSLYRIIRDLGLAAGVKARPHGLRHAAITEALDLMRGNLRAVARFSRHRDERVLRVYDDNREDLGGEVARLVAL